jgi:hypothetical protein
MVVGRNVVGRLQLFTFTEILGSLTPVHKKRNYIINDVKSKFFLLKKVNSFSWSWKCFKWNSISGLSNVMSFVWTRVLCLFGFFSLKWEVEFFAFFSFVVTITVCVIGWQQASHCRKSGLPVWVIQVVALAVVFPVALEAALIYWGKPDRSRRWRSAKWRTKVMTRGLRLGADCTFKINLKISDSYFLKWKFSLGRLWFMTLRLCSSNMDSVADFMSCCWFDGLIDYTFTRESLWPIWKKNANSLYDQIAAYLQQYLTQVVDINAGHGTYIRSV